MAVWTIAGLTLKEAIRRKTLLGAFLLGVLILGLSFLVTVIRIRMHHAMEHGRMTETDFAMRLPIARSAITMLCLSAIKIVGSLFALILAGGSISSEVERGLLAVILPKPIPRWHILLGKWIGLNIVLMGSVFVWAVMVWTSLSLQTHLDFSSILHAGVYLALYPLLICTVSLTLSTFAQRLFGTSLALALIIFGWFDGILNTLGTSFDVDSLHTWAQAAQITLPQSILAWWIEDVMGDVAAMPTRGGPAGQSPTFIYDWGHSHLHFEYLDVTYFAFYILMVFLLGVLVFHKRDV